MARNAHLPFYSGPISGMTLSGTPCFPICTPGKTVIWGTRDRYECEHGPGLPRLPLPGGPCLRPPCHMPHALRLLVVQHHAQLGSLWTPCGCVHVGIPLFTVARCSAGKRDHEPDQGVGMEGGLMEKEAVVMLVGTLGVPRQSKSHNEQVVWQWSL